MSWLVVEFKYRNAKKLVLFLARCMKSRNDGETSYESARTCKQMVQLPDGTNARDVKLEKQLGDDGKYQPLIYVEFELGGGQRKLRF